VEYLLLLLGFVILIKGGDWLLNSSVNFSLKLNIPKIIVGLTVVSFATSAPELMVSVLSAFNGSSDLAVGNVIGSNIANIALILAVVLLFSKISLNKSFFQKDYVILLFSTFLFYLLSFYDHNLGSIDGIIFILILIIYVAYLIKSARTDTFDDTSAEFVNVSWVKIILTLLLGIIALYFGSELLVSNAIIIAMKLGVSERVIGVTIVAIGTSLPELVASLVAIKKKENAISFGNIIGSNIFNILCVLGLTSLIHPINITPSFLLFDFWWMLLIVLIIPVFSFLPQKGTIDYKFGIFLLVAYLGYLYLSF
jgi:cation:H+ antiporter